MTIRKEGLSDEKLTRSTIQNALLGKTGWWKDVKQNVRRREWLYETKDSAGCKIRTYEEKHKEKKHQNHLEKKIRKKQHHREL